MMLFLAAYMKKGFGVSVVIDALCREYTRLGVDVTIGCLESDGFFQGTPIVVLKPDAESVKALASKIGAGVIVAHTTPFFELLPQLAGKFRVWSWEHGDPDPEFFIWDRYERQAIIDRKQREIYQHLDGVIAISEFIRDEINYPKAAVVYNGCDHIKKTRNNITNTSRLRVGTLVRLGTGETTYKGRPILTQLYKALRRLDTHVELHIMGRGTKKDKESLENMGVVVHLNASDEERLEYLNNLDIFVSTSLWEGFNLPVVEAQACGTVGIAFDVGAHPETTPFVTRGIDDMASLIEHYCRHPELLRKHSEMCERWVRRKFSWNSAATASAKLLLGDRLS